jgi:uncharacterized membrane protein HdeD (DUF308 family)
MESSKKKNYFSKLAWGVIILLALYFIVTNALNYFRLTEEAYGNYFWPRVNWVFPHVIFGILAMLVGPFQFSNKLRARYLVIHRRLGYVYLVSILLGATAGIALSLTSKVSVTYKMGLFFLAVAWLLTSGMALFFILKRKITQHKEWMVRSYVVTFAFVIFRLFADLMTYYEISDAADRNALMSWACWAVPLLFLEPILQYRKTVKKRIRK